MLNNQKQIIVILGDKSIHKDNRWGFFNEVMTKILNQDRTEFSENLWKTFNWFSSDLAQLVKNSCAEFFGLDIEMKLFSIGENNNVLFRGDRYFVTEIKTTKNLSIGVRLSLIAVNALLNSALGTKEKHSSSIEKISELESKIITSFNEFLYSNLQKIIVPTNEIDKEAQPKSFCYIVFYLSYKQQDFGKLVLTIPTNLLNPNTIDISGDRFTLSDFKSCSANFKIKVGTSKIKLGEVRSLQVDDIILLENSNIYKMNICNAGHEYEFKISPNPSIILDTDNEGEDMEENTSANNIWDNIQVDINAEFEKVKISLGELKQISEGLVVDIGSIYNNKIDLRVENKLVAKGELVIINDRYGVRIDEVVPPDTPKINDIETQIPINSTEENQELNEEEFDNDDFNYDDFDEEEI